MNDDFFENEPRPSQDPAPSPIGDPAFSRPRPVSDQPYSRLTPIDDPFYGRPAPMDDQPYSRPDPTPDQNPYDNAYNHPYEQENVPWYMQDPYYRPYGYGPRHKTRRTPSKAWKILAGMLCLVCLCASVFGGVYMASSLRNRRIQANEKINPFKFPERPQEQVDAGDITDYQNMEYNSIAEIADDVGRSVVTIITTLVSEDSSSIMGDTYYGEALGSGVIIGEDGNELYIATNFHVIEGATDVKVLIGDDDFTTVTAYYKGSDSESDLAVIYVKKSEIDNEVLKEIKIATLGESDELKVGDLAIAIGSPLAQSYSHSVTAGIISGLERSVTFIDEKTKLSNTLILLQTDAAINPGNSGGALVNGRGEVIGINDAKIVSDDVEGMGFAIPMSTAKPILEALIAKGKVMRPYLGITGTSIIPGTEFSSQYGLISGALVQTVVDGLSASKAGILPDDVIISFNGVTIEDFDDLKKAVQACEIGQTVDVIVIRGYTDGDAQTVTLQLTIEEKPGDYE